MRCDPGWAAPVDVPAQVLGNTGAMPGAGLRPGSIWLCIRRLAALVALGISLTASSGLVAGKSEKWLEVRSPHFIVVTNGSPKAASKVAFQFETLRAVWQKTFAGTRVDPNAPPIILAVKDEESLKQLLPQYWEQRGHLHPAGLFLGGEEKQYVVLRMDAMGSDPFADPTANPYQVIYHEYVHLLVNLNYSWLPLWLNEGLAELYGNTRVTDKGVALGRPIGSHVQQLRRQDLLPLLVLFTADHSSPYYHEVNKATIFYAESWALTHYLILGDKMAHGEQFANYVKLLRGGAEPQDAARRTIGDPATLEDKLRKYLKGFTLPYALVKSPVEVVEDGFPVRELSPAESLVARGDFLVYSNRPIEGRALLEQALKFDPDFAPAYESLGFSHIREGKKEEGAKFIEQAMKLDSRNYLAYYYHAMWGVGPGQILGGDVPGTMVPDLQRALELNPDFAPACAALANVYGNSGQHLKEAHRLAVRATELEPGNLRYHLVLAQVLLRQEQPEDAIKICRRVQAAAKNPRENAEAQIVLHSAQQYLDYQMEMKRNEDRARVLPPLPHEPGEREGEGSGWPQPDPSSTAPSEKALPIETLQVIVEGKIIEVSCAAKGLLKLTLARSTYNLELRASDYRRIKLLASDGTPLLGAELCRQLQGSQARVTYKAGGADAGEIVSLELRE